MVIRGVVRIEWRGRSGTDPGGLEVSGEGSHLSREVRFEKPPRLVHITDRNEGESSHLHEGFSDRRVVDRVVSSKSLALQVSPQGLFEVEPASSQGSTRPDVEDCVSDSDFIVHQHRLRRFTSLYSRITRHCI